MKAAAKARPAKQVEPSFFSHKGVKYYLPPIRRTGKIPLKKIRALIAEIVAERKKPVLPP